LAPISTERIKVGRHLKTSLKCWEHTSLQSCVKQISFEDIHRVRIFFGKNRKFIVSKSSLHEYLRNSSGCREMIPDVNRICKKDWPSAQWETCGYVLKVIFS
jgi:hypothetical protein